MPKGKGGHRERSDELDVTQDNRRQLVLRLRMKWPPYSIQQIADQLKISTVTVMKDIRYLRTQFSSAYFAENNAAAVGRACAELQTMAYQFLTEAEQLDATSQSTERAALYGRSLQALQQRNDIMMECGIMSKAAIKIETSGPDGKPIQYDLTTSSVQERIAALKAAAKNPKPVEE